jgi:hypothetical protein
MAKNLSNSTRRNLLCGWRRPRTVNSRRVSILPWCQLCHVKAVFLRFTPLFSERIDHDGVGRHCVRLGSTQIPGRRKQIHLDELIAAHGQSNTTCPPITRPIFNSPGTNFSSHHTIPLVIHQTCKSRCVTDDVYNLSLAWKALGVPYYFHDDAAIERLILSRIYEEFPHLCLVWENCITKPVVKTDLWRLLLLYEYGGINADYLDTKPCHSIQDSLYERMMKCVLSLI